MTHKANMAKTGVAAAAPRPQIFGSAVSPAAALAPIAAMTACSSMSKASRDRIFSIISSLTIGGRLYLGEEGSGEGKGVERERRVE